MSWLHRWLVPVVAIVGVLAVVAGLVTSSLAMFAAIVGIASILLNLEKHLRDKAKEEKEALQKEDDKRESLKATIEVRRVDKPPKAIGIELFNAGKVVVPIKSVRLILRKGEAESAFMMVHTERRGSISVLSGGSTIVPLHHRERINLEPKEHIEFYDESVSKEGLDAILAAAAEDVSIVVDSFNGEVLRVGGKAIQEAIEVARSKSKK